MKWSLCLLAAVAAISTGVGITHASGPIAVYALVDKVTMEPDADHPERIQVSGVFILAAAQGSSYSGAQRGYLYYSLPKGQDSAQALREWGDLKSVAGTGQVVGFGQGWFENGTQVHKNGEKADAPQPWVLSSNGLVKVNASHPQAKALLEFKDR